MVIVNTEIDTYPNGGVVITITFDDGSRMEIRPTAMGRQVYGFWYEP